MLEIFERLAAAGIDLLPAEIATHFLFVRGGFVSLVERREKGFGNIGAPGLLIEQGFAALVWRGGEPFFVGRGYERRAEAAEVAALREFDRALRECLGASGTGQ
ncbi:MAG: hypothetical protein NTX13_16520 [Acidobacteria bacterium]|nr:hypothetical protein [Acidobacteriota bacterium]